MEVRLTLDDGTQILLDRLDSVDKIEDEEKYRIQGIGSLGETDVTYDQSTPEAIRTIEFLP